jgi:hypothetical protein
VSSGHVEVGARLSLSLRRLSIKACLEETLGWTFRRARVVRSRSSSARTSIPRTTGRQPTGPGDLTAPRVIGS